MKELTFEKHVEEIKKDLELDINPPVFVGDCATEYAKKKDKIYREKHNRSLKHEFENLNGLYLWLEKEDTVLLKNENVGTLAHELRHAWQYKNRKKYLFIFSKFISNSKVLGNLFYSFSRKEWNANNYARKYCKSEGFTEISRKYFWKLINQICWYIIIIIIITIISCIIF